MSRLLHMGDLINLGSSQGAVVFMLAGVAFLTSCRSDSEFSGPGATNTAITPDLDAEIARASNLRQPILVLVAESAKRRADDQSRARLESLAGENKSIASVLLDLKYRDLTDPRFKGHIGMANPLSGGMASHVAALFAKLGENQGRHWLEGLKSNDCAIWAGMADLKNRVASGELWFGITATDEPNFSFDAGERLAGRQNLDGIL
jgi:hypothetical protein